MRQQNGETTLDRRSFVKLAGVMAAGSTLTARGGMAYASEGGVAGEAETPGAGLTDGTYSTTAVGMAGQFEVSASCAAGQIEAIEVGENNETVSVGTAALDILGRRIVENQSLGVDVVAGATYSSLAIINAMRDLVEQAGGDVAALEEAPVVVDTYEGKPTDADVVVVGGGLAGVCAAISAAQGGASVILLEALEFNAGNAALSTGTFLLGKTSIQEAAGIEDDTESFYEWILEKSEYEKDPDQTRLIADNSQALVDWFGELGVEFSPEVNTTEGCDVSRNHSIAPSIGEALETLVAKMDELGVDVRYATKGQGLILDDDGAVRGVRATNYDGEEVEYTAQQVVLASGGFGDNNDKIVQYWGKEYDGIVYGGLKGMDGTMLWDAMDIGADTVDMNAPHIDATLEVNKGVTITSNLLVKCGGILVRQSTGQRFVDETTDHCEQAASAMHDLGDEHYWEIFDNGAKDYNASVSRKFEAYKNMGLFTTYDSLEELAVGIEVDEAALRETIERYNAAVRGDEPDEFGREMFNAELAAPFHAMKVANGVACTTGGLKVDADMRVLDTSGNPIPNLYAIGEIAGGYLVRYRGGDSLSHSAIGGMLVGRALAEMDA